MTPPSPTSELPALGLALRYRPRTLDEVVGQRPTRAVLRKAIANGRVPRQLLFSGGSGLGKTTIARVVAAALLCESPVDGDACGSCESCLDITTPGRVHPDVIEFDAASHGLKEQVKELAARAVTAPLRGRLRIYIADEAHGLSLGGGQAFLKLLEEPPPHVVFMLATTDPDKMLQTNRSRCIEFELSRPTDDEIAEHLCHVASMEGWALSDAVARAVIAATDPVLGLRGCLMTLEKLADTLAWGTEPSDDELAALLGTAPATGMARLCAAISAGDQATALSSVESLRRSVADTSVRRALLDWARRSLIDAFAGSAMAPELALWRYETAAGTPPGPLWTEILVCKLARPELDPTPAALGAQLADASAAVAELRTAALDARSAVTRSGPALDPVTPSRPTVRPAPAKPDPAAVAPARPRRDEPRTSSPGAERPRMPDKPAVTAAAPEASTRSEATVPPSPASFIEALAGLSKKDAALARSANVTAAGTTITVSAPEGLHRRIIASRVAFEAAAQQVGASVEFHKA